MKYLKPCNLLLLLAGTATVAYAAAVPGACKHTAKSFGEIYGMPIQEIAIFLNELKQPACVDQIQAHLFNVPPASVVAFFGFLKVLMRNGPDGLPMLRRISPDVIGGIRPEWCNAFYDGEEWSDFVLGSNANQRARIPEACLRGAETITRISQSNILHEFPALIPNIPDMLVGFNPLEMPQMALARNIDAGIFRRAFVDPRRCNTIEPEAFRALGGAWSPASDDHFLKAMTPDCLDAIPNNCWEGQIDKVPSLPSTAFQGRFTHPLHENVYAGMTDPQLQAFISIPENLQFLNLNWVLSRLPSTFTSLLSNSRQFWKDNL